MQSFFLKFNFMQSDRYMCRNQYSCPLNARYAVFESAIRSHSKNQQHPHHLLHPHHFHHAHPLIISKNPSITWPPVSVAICHNNFQQHHQRQQPQHIGHHEEPGTTRPATSTTKQLVSTMVMMTRSDQQQPPPAEVRWWLTAVELLILLLRWCHCSCAMAGREPQFSVLSKKWDPLKHISTSHWNLQISASWNHLRCTFMIVSMQLGFAMLEVGCVRQEHRMTVLDTWLNISGCERDGSGVTEYILIHHQNENWLLKSSWTKFAILFCNWFLHALLTVFFWYRSEPCGSPGLPVWPSEKITPQQALDFWCFNWCAWDMDMNDSLPKN